MILGLVAFCASCRIAHAAATAFEDKPHQKEAIRVSSDGEIRVHQQGATKSMIRAETSTQDEVEAAHHEHHDHKEHKHGHTHQTVDAAGHIEAAQAHVPDRIEESHESVAEHVGIDHQFDHAAELAKAKEAHYQQIHAGVDADAELAQLDSESDMLHGQRFNPSDLANKAQDILMGTAGVIPEDYPFVCICGATGKCSETGIPADKLTPCPGRKGTGASAHSGASLGVVAMLVVLVSSLYA